MDAIRMQGIVKCFGPVRANDGIDFTVGKQEIHCLLGENGTGKSTLMNILFGLYHPDEGEIYINEKKAAISNPNDAYALGIGMVHQHFMLVNQLTVLENIIIGKEQGGLILDRKASEEKVSQLIERFGFQIDLHEKVVNLSVGMRQRVEILKTLYRGADIIILDEPTAVLTPQEVEELFKILRQLKEDGKTIVFITHKLNETMSLSDWITVIRKGKVVFRCNTADTNEKELATQMVGRSVETVVSQKSGTVGAPVLEIQNIRIQDKAQETVSLTVHAGEILGIAGVDGNGQQELEGMISGNQRVREGTILICGTPVEKLPVKERKKLGLGYIPSDRHRNAMVPSFSIAENFLLGYQEEPEWDAAHCRGRLGIVLQDKIRSALPCHRRSAPRRPDGGRTGEPLPLYRNDGRGRNCGTGGLLSLPLPKQPFRDGYDRRTRLHGACRQYLWRVATGGVAAGRNGVCCGSGRPVLSHRPGDSLSACADAALYHYAADSFVCRQAGKRTGSTWQTGGLGLYYWQGQTVRHANKGV